VDAQQLEAALGGDSPFINFEKRTDSRRLAGIEIAALYETMNARFDTVDAKLGTVDAKLGTVDARFDTVDARLGSMDTRLDRVDARLEKLALMMERVMERLENVPTKAEMQEIINRSGPALAPVARSASSEPTSRAAITRSDSRVQH
jgi:flagellin-like hook-associated protein FlgL